MLTSLSLPVSYREFTPHNNHAHAGHTHDMHRNRACGQFQMENQHSRPGDVGSYVAETMYDVTTEVLLTFVRS